MKVMGNVNEKAFSYFEYGSEDDTQKITLYEGDMIVLSFSEPFSGIHSWANFSKMFEKAKRLLHSTKVP